MAQILVLGCIAEGNSEVMVDTSFTTGELAAVLLP